MTKYAHIMKVSGGYELCITTQLRPVGGAVVKVPDKKTARKIAAQFNATPWNF